MVNTQCKNWEQFHYISILGKLMHGLTKNTTAGELGWLQKQTTMPSFLNLVIARGCRNTFITASTNCSPHKPYLHNENKSNEMSQPTRQVVWVHTGETTS